MALAFIIIGAALIVAAIRDQQGQLGTLVAGDFTGSSSFLDWIAVAAIIGAVGYVPALQTPSRAFMALLLVVVFLTKGQGFFSQLSSALSGASSQAATPIQNPATPQTGIPVELQSGGTSSGISGALSTAGQAAGLFGL